MSPVEDITPICAFPSNHLGSDSSSNGHTVRFFHSGGTSVTSMNPISKELWQEGLSVTTFKLVSEGHFDEDGVRELFRKAGDYPGSSMTRRIDHNLTDLHAAIAANVRGIGLVEALFKEFGTRKVLFYMKEIQSLAARTVKAFFKDVYNKFEGRPLRARDFVSTRYIFDVKVSS